MNLKLAEFIELFLQFSDCKLFLPDFMNQKNWMCKLCMFSQIRSRMYTLQLCNLKHLTT